MDLATHAGVPEPRSDGPRPEPRWTTLADFGVIVAGVALVMTIPSRALGWPAYLPPPPLLFLVVIGGLRLTVEFGLVLALVVLFRHGRYGGTVRPAEWLVLGLASLGLLGVAPNLDEAVNAYYAAVGSAALDFGVARWLLSAPAAAGVVLVVAGLSSFGVGCATGRGSHQRSRSSPSWVGCSSGSGGRARSPACNCRGC